MLNLFKKLVNKSEGSVSIELDGTEKEEELLDLVERDYIKIEHDNDSGDPFGWVWFTAKGKALAWAGLDILII